MGGLQTFSVAVCSPIGDNGWHRHDELRPRHWQPMVQQIEDLFKLRAFYAECSPLPRHAGLVDRIYVLKDCGIMTADCRSFSSPFFEIAFVVPAPVGDVSRKPKVVVARPRFGQVEKRRPFHGWIFGIKGMPGLPLDVSVAVNPVEHCRDHLVQAAANPVAADVLAIIDQFLDELTNGAQVSRVGQPISETIRVTRFANQSGKSVRTLHRQIRQSTGLAPKRLLATGRFSRVVHQLAISASKLSGIASDLGFADQAHLTRDFRKHTGLSPGAFQRTWTGVRGHAVRFVQDAPSPHRLVVAAWPSGECD